MAMAVVRTFIRASKDKNKLTTPQKYYTGETRLLFYYIYILRTKRPEKLMTSTTNKRLII